MLALAREHNAALSNVEWVHGDGASLAPIADASVDGCFSHVVFQHIPEAEITLGYIDEIGRVLASGGWAAFQISNDPALHARAEDHDPAWRGSAVDLAELRARAEAAGMTVERVVGEGTQFCLVRLSRA
jgi:SAM-dependent methyltransferase